MLDNLFNLVVSLSGGSYEPSRSVCFVSKQPKLREIFAADFRDRVVHHLIVPEIEKIFEPKFIHDSYACRMGKGTHAAVYRLKSFMNRISKGCRAAAWFIQLDVKSFFMSIDREILLGILARHVRDKRLFTIVETIVRQNCTKNYIYKGDPKLLRMIPPHKSLFHIPEGKGLPIGNLTSQFFGNVYLNEMDQFVKHKLKAKYYVRYVDDFILLDESRDRLLLYKTEIAGFLNKRLKLEIKRQYTLKRVSEGSNFLGYVVRPDYVLVRNRVIGNLRARIRQFEREMVTPPILPLSKGRSENGVFIHIHLREEKVKALRQTLASYLGHFKHADSYRLIRSLFDKYSYLKDIFSVDAECRLIPLYEPRPEPECLYEQYKWAAEQYSLDYCIFLQTGKFCELYGQRAEIYGKALGLNLTPGRRMSGLQAGFPMSQLKGFKKMAQETGLQYVVMCEEGYYASGLKRRVITEIFRRAE